ncbi:unnamed protein product [Urochloa humidicola]
MLKKRTRGEMTLLPLPYPITPHLPCPVSYLIHVPSHLLSHTSGQASERREGHRRSEGEEQETNGAGSMRFALGGAAGGEQRGGAVAAAARGWTATWVPGFREPAAHGSRCG